MPTYDDSQVDSRGRIIDPVHNYDTPLPLKDDVSGEYYFQQVGQAVSITTQPTNQSKCIGESAKFEVVGSHPTGDISYQWQFLDSATGIWNDLNGTDTKITGFDTDKLEITDVDNSLAGEYRVQLKTDEFQCTTDSNSGVSLTVNTPPAPPVVESIQTFCLTDNPTVGDLAIAPAPANPAGLVISVYDNYDPSDSSIGTLLNGTDLLIDGQTYYIQVTDNQGCIGVSRSQTKVLLPNPVITPSVGESCPGDEITITVSGVPQTALDFELANATLTKVLSDYTDSYGIVSSYFVDPVSRSFSEAENLLPTYGIGASMYQINDLAEHDAVFNAIQANGLANVPLWLGLKQYPALNPNKKFDQGWYWLDGRELDPTWSLWDSAEPNDYDFDADCNGTGSDSDNIDDGSEDFGHFNLGGDKLLNDYPDCPGAPSRPVYEFSGITTIKWYYEDPNNPGSFIDIPVNASTLTLNPELTTTYYIDVTTNGTVCSTSYTHVVNPLPVPTAVGNLELCDEIDPTDPTTTNTDGIAHSFDLDSQTPLIVDGQVDRDGNPYAVTYWKTLAEATDPLTYPASDGLSSPYINELDPLGSPYDPQTIYVRLKDEATGCFDASLTFDIIVNTTPESNVVAVPPVVCDDLDSTSDVDGSSKFDLTLVNDEILGATQVAAGGFEVTYYYEDASGTKVLIADPTAHYNTPDSAFDPADPTVQTEEIFVRVTDTNASTFALGRTLRLY